MRNLYDMRILHVSLFGYLVLKKAGINESFVVGSDTVQVFFVAFPLGFNRWYHPLESKKVCFDQGQMTPEIFVYASSNEK